MDLSFSIFLSLPLSVFLSHYSLCLSLFLCSCNFSSLSMRWLRVRFSATTFVMNALRAWWMRGCVANLTHAYRPASTARNNRNALKDEKNNVGINMLSNSFNIKIIFAFPAASQFTASNPKWVCLVAFYCASTWKMYLFFHETETSTLVASTYSAPLFPVHRMYLPFSRFSTIDIPGIHIIGVCAKKQTKISNRTFLCESAFLLLGSI